MERDGYTITRLAQRLGTGTGKVSNYVSGARFPRSDEWAKLAEALPSLDIHYVVTGQRRAHEAKGNGVAHAPTPRTLAEVIGDVTRVMQAGGGEALAVAGVVDALRPRPEQRAIDEPGPVPKAKGRAS